MVIYPLSSLELHFQLGMSQKSSNALDPEDVDSKEMVKGYMWWTLLPATSRYFDVKTKVITRALNCSHISEKLPVLFTWWLAIGMNRQSWRFHLQCGKQWTKSHLQLLIVICLFVYENCNNAIWGWLWGVDMIDYTKKFWGVHGRWSKIFTGRKKTLFS